MEIRLRTGQVMTESEFRAAHPNTSFPQQLTVELLNGFDADPVLNGAQAQPTRYQTAYQDGVEEINGQWFTKFSVADMDAEAIASIDANQAKSVRDERNRKLTASDWTQVADAPVDLLRPFRRGVEALLRPTRLLFLHLRKLCGRLLFL